MYYGIDMAATGANIKRLRQERALTVRDIQEAMGFDVPSAVYKWERGRSLPSLEHLMALSKLFDVRMEEILIWSRPPPGAVTERERRSLRIKSQGQNEEKVQVRDGHDKKAGGSQPGRAGMKGISIMAG